MIRRLSRTIFQETIRDRSRRRAISFAILVKYLKPSSVVKDWTYNELARMTQISWAACRKYIHTLKDMKLVRMYSHKGHNYLIFKKLREHKKKNRWSDGYHTPRRKDVMLGDFTPSSIKEIEIRLQALLICEIQRQKDYAEQSISAKQNPKNLHECKKAQRICRARGWDSFSDCGISYKHLCGELHCSPNTLSATIRYGEKAGLFTVTRSEPICLFCDPEEETLIPDYIDTDNIWYTDEGAFYQPANRYSLSSSA